MKPNELKMEVRKECSALPALLRGVADDLESCSQDVLQRIEAEGFEKVRMTLKRDGASCRAKVKVRLAPRTVLQPRSDAAGEAAVSVVRVVRSVLGVRPKYSALKKRMKGPWKLVRLAASQSVLPEKALLEGFIRDCRLMAGYPGQGDEYYGPFKKTLQDITVAYTAKDAAGFASAVAEMERVVEACHAVYK